MSFEEVKVESEWSEEEIAQTLYKGDPDAASIHEIKIVVVDNVNEPERSFWNRWWKWTSSAIDKKRKDRNSEAEGEDEEQEEEEEKDFVQTYLNIDLNPDEVEDVAHVVLFYAEWCPHCQHYKSTYIALEAEINRRSIGTTVKFHAVSCTLNQMVCETYGVDGYPFAMGWRASSPIPEHRDIKKPGVLLNDLDEMTADSIAGDLLFEIAEEGVRYDEPEEPYSDSEDQKAYERDKIQWGIDAALEKVQRYEYKQDINDRYHNAAASLTYVLKKGVYASGKGELNQEQKRALKDFLNLVDWATPLEWNVRKKLVQDLQEHFDDVVTIGRESLIQLVEKHQGSAFKAGWRREELLWGYVDETIRTRETFGGSNPRRRNVVKGLGGEAHRRQHYTDEKSVLKENGSWTGACTHGLPYSGYTCGLWDLFHILTVGSVHTRNQLYGFRQGYIVSSREVAFAIRNFIASFFRCDVCRKHFLQMYDDCGHRHCQRLNDRLPFAREEWLGLPVLMEREDDASDAETALWLWEVHNAVNVRLMQEAAERDRRKVSKEEIKASKFPTKNMCPKCWLDEDMEIFDSNEVTNFLLKWYWPMDESEHTILSTTEIHRAQSLEGMSLPSLGLFIIAVPLSMMFLSMSLDAIRKMRKTSNNTTKTE